MYVNTFLELLDELEKSPDVTAKQAWEHAMQYEPKSLSAFAGPQDPRYVAYLKKDYLENLAESREYLARVMETKP